MNLLRTGWLVLRRVLGESLGLWAALGLLVLVFGLATDHFFSALTFRTIANQIPALLLVATAMTFVLVLGQIDLSVGSVLAFSGAVTGTALVHWAWPPWAALVAGLATGLACGTFNGLVAIRWRLPSFIVTLGMLEMARGGAHAVTRSQTQYLGSTFAWIAETQVMGLSLPFLMAMTVVVGAQAVLTRTVLGRYAIAIGTNEEAVRLSGIDPRPVKLVIFAGTGLLVALAALMDVARFESANPNAGLGLELVAIAAAVIGGTSLLGGRGSILATFLGVLIMAVLNAGLASVGVRDEMKRLITGAVIIVAVILDVYRHRTRSPG